ncbi:hypothetical protein ACNSOO_04630 [Aliarcobacter lanthieri]|uniref:hypothetical protein n=1 Tax=Aliarcobacter lanthieri TaxID=1355374 RepID=UPI003AB0B581
MNGSKVWQLSNWEVGIYSSGLIPSYENSINDELSIYEEFDDLEQRYYYFDTKFLEYVTPEDNFEEVASIIEGMALIGNGAIVLRTKCIQKILKIDWDNIYYDSNKVHFPNRNLPISMNPFSIISTSQNTQVNNNINSILGIVNLSRKHDEIREILFMIGVVVDIPNINRNISIWTTLYAIADTIFYYMEHKYKAREYISINRNKHTKDKALEMINTNKTKYELFARTANNFDYLGVYSRHGKQSSTPPSSPMLLDDALNFIFSMVDSFFAFCESKNFR